MLNLYKQIFCEMQITRKIFYEHLFSIDLSRILFHSAFVISPLKMQLMLTKKFHKRYFVQSKSIKQIH